jgi:signal peptidase I
MIALAVAFLVQATLAKPYEIPTQSMEPTIQSGIDEDGVRRSGGDRILANRLVYRFRDVDRGDIIVFDATTTAREVCRGQDPNVPFVKRVIAIGGDTVRVTPSGPVVNGEPFVVEDAQLENGGTLGEVTVPEDHVFVLGDNRGQSCDSVEWAIAGDPFVPVDRIIGQAEATYWPLDRIGFLS